MECFNVVGIGAVKISVCLCLLRVVDKARRKLTRFLVFLIFFVAISHVGLALSFFLYCVPIQALWNPNSNGNCNSTPVAITVAVYIGFSKPS